MRFGIGVEKVIIRIISAPGPEAVSGRFPGGALSKL